MLAAIVIHRQKRTFLVALEPDYPASKRFMPQAEITRPNFCTVNCPGELTLNRTNYLDERIPDEWILLEGGSEFVLEW
ncbi:MAG: hypothetical protein IJR85_03740 [Synergistaceae bacterium]|nr:hypothetical protein [Synergistaceae bacterium]